MISLKALNHRGHRAAQRFGIGRREEAEGRRESRGKLGFSPRRHGDHGERKGWVWVLSKQTKAFNAEGRRSPIRADRRGPQEKTYRSIGV